MINGVVNSVLEATIRIQIRDAAAGVQQIESTVDTGYNGFLLLQPAQNSALGLPWLKKLSVALADGSVQYIDVYAATVIWDGVPRSVEVDAIARNPLIGMKLLEGCELRIKVVEGGFVNILTPP
jgi:clan AA aspartic protease